MRRPAILLIVAALLAACGAPAPPARIAFTSDRDGNYEIYVIPASGPQPQASAGPLAATGGTGLTNLTNNPANDAFPVPSPDLSQIAFLSERDGNLEIYLMPAPGPQAQVTADGSSVVNLTNNPGFDMSVAWSPDGSRIAFTSNRDGDTEICVVPVPGPQAQVSPSPLAGTDGSGLTCLTDNSAEDGLPAWSPDGKHIAFTSDRDGNLDIYLIPAPGPQAQASPDGSDVVNLTANPAQDYGAAWSPDGKRIVFTSDRDGNQEVYMVNADGTGLANLTNNPAEDRLSAPEQVFCLPSAWSPDGRRILFTSNRNGSYELYVMDAGGSRQTYLSSNPAQGGLPAWSPDGKRIAFTSNRDGNLEIYVIDAGGTGLANLTTNPANDAYPVWSP